MSEVLTAQLEAALLRELASLYAWENDARFRGTLRTPMLALSDSATRLGRWSSPTRTLELSRTLVLAQPWPEVVSVLLHEMAHQYVDEVVGARDEAAHGETFRAVCAERGIDGRAAGAPEPAAGSPDADRVLERIRKLLALAASANQHEAEIAMRRAHELMLRHNIETAGRAGGYEVRHLGDPRKRGNRVEDDIVALLGEFFFVKVIRVPVYLPLEGKRGAVFEIAGTRANVELAEHVYAFLLATVDRMWHEVRASNVRRRERGDPRVAQGAGKPPSIDDRVRSGRDRRSYQSGCVRGFRDKLAAERSALRGTGLVWIGDGDLDRFYRARNPRITTRQRRVRVDGAHAAGREAGRSIVLHKPVTATGGGPRKLLTSS
jgi:hypothetical protein